MARHKKVDPKQLAARLKTPPKCSASSRARINALTEDKVLRRSMCAQAARYEEMIEELRPQIIKGVASAYHNSLKAEKQLADLLQTKGVKPQTKKKGLKKLPPWLEHLQAKPAPATPPAPPPAPPADDADLEAALAKA